MDGWRRTSVASRVVCVCSCVLAVVSAQQQQQHQKKTAADHLGLEVVVSAPEDDLTAAASTSGHGGGHGNSKFFMYAHQPDKKQYEFGFKRGNNYHNMERYEKAGPNHDFKTKVRWEDAKGGHGEHYWDYNHGPKYQDDHSDDHGGYGHDHHDGGHGHGGYGHDDHGHGGYGHDDHGHGGYGHDDHGHGGYGHDDHGHGGYGHDDHGHESYGHDDQGHGDYGQGDHGGYHSQPVPDYAPATTTASASTIDTLSQLGKRQRSSHPSKLHRSTDAHRPERKSPKSVPNKVGVDKDADLGKKNYHYYNEKQTFEYRTSSSSDDLGLGEESSSELLGFNPHPPPGASEEDFPPGSASTRRSSPSAFRRRSGGKEDVPSALEDCAAATTSVEASSTSGLSFDPEIGRVYSQQTGLWYNLVPVESS